MAKQKELEPSNKLRLETLAEDFLIHSTNYGLEELFKPFIFFVQGKNKKQNNDH